MDVEAAVDGIACSGLPVAQQREGLETVKKLLTNLQTSPAEEKFRQVKKTNPAIQKRLFPQCFDLLRSAGFEDSGELLVYRRDPASDMVLSEVQIVIESVLLSLPEAPRVAAPAAGGYSSSSTGAVSSRAPAPSVSKKSALERAQEKTKAEMQASQASASDQLAALRRQNAGKYQQQQDSALARHLSGREADRPYDAITALNVSRGATSALISCTRCGSSLRYNSATRAQAVLCPCGMLLQPVHMQGHQFRPSGPSDLPVEPGEPVDADNRPRMTRGPFITVRGPDGEPTRLPLHSVLSMVRQHGERQQTGADDETIEALPTRVFDGSRDEGGDSDGKCQICMEEFAEGDELRTLPCFHLFHSACVDQWLKVNCICPTCRHKIE